MKDFVELKPSLRMMDRYVIRKGILDSIQKSMESFNGKLLDFGCGKMPYRSFLESNSNIEEYVGMDISSDLDYGAVKPDVTWDGVTMPFGDNVFNVTFGTEVLEHCPDPQRVLDENYRVLNEGGILFFTVPFLWNLHEVPYDEFRYTPFSLERMLKKAGFDEVNIYPTGGWHASFAQMIGLWCRRAAGGKWSTLLFSILFYPFWRLLIRKDKPVKKMGEGTLMPGLYVVAKK